MLAALVVLMLAAPARAYRPFDGTDADVAQLGEVELEVGPVGYLRSGSRSAWIVPAIIFNYGFRRDFELVIEGRNQIQQHVDPTEPGSQLTDSAVSVKEVLREGCLQGHPGLSIANEWSVLLPDTGRDQRWGAELTTIFSARFQPLTLHLNVYNELSRQHHYVGSLGPIIEGPFSWPLRPVMELIAAREFGSARLGRGLFGSVLVGAIASVRESLTIDWALLYGKTADTREQALRVGFTWAFDTGYSP